MSVINKVLRDLDHRAAAGGQPVDNRPAASDDSARMPPGVVPVAALPGALPQVRAQQGWRAPALLASMLALGVGLWWWQSPGGTGSAGSDASTVHASGPATPPPAPTQVVVAAAPAPAPASMPVAAQSEALFPAGTVRPDVLGPVPVPVPVASPPLAPQLAAPAAATTTAVPAAGPSPPTVRLANQPATVPPASAPYRVAVAAPAPKPVEAELAPAVLPAPVPWPDAALDAVGQAQRMWSTGARDTALAFLRDALAGVERAHGTDLVPDRAGATAGLAMVRELVRMEQVMANHVQVLALLKRHEVLWAREPDLWAVRGSAAQRLSQHADAADSYRTALRLRPGEPRWMLGAAVSLAALGRQADAAQLAEQARRSGPVSPEVWSYLRQLGVPLASDNPAN